MHVLRFALWVGVSVFVLLLAAPGFSGATTTEPDPGDDETAAEEAAPLDIRSCAALLGLKPGSVVIVDDRELVRVPRVDADEASADDELAEERPADLLECARRIGLPPGPAEPFEADTPKGERVSVPSRIDDDPLFHGPKPTLHQERHTLALRDLLIWPGRVAVPQPAPAPDVESAPSLPEADDGGSLTEMVEPERPTLDPYPVPELRIETARLGFRWPGEERVPLSLVRDIASATMSRFAVAEPGIVNDVKFAIDLPLRDEAVLDGAAPLALELPMPEQEIEVVRLTGGGLLVASARGARGLQVASARGALGVRRARARVLPEPSGMILLGISFAGFALARRSR